MGPQGLDWFTMNNIDLGREAAELLSQYDPLDYDDLSEPLLIDIVVMDQRFKRCGMYSNILADVTRAILDKHLGTSFDESALMKIADNLKEINIALYDSPNSAELKEYSLSCLLQLDRMDLLILVLDLGPDTREVKVLESALKCWRECPNIKAVLSEYCTAELTKFDKILPEKLRATAAKYVI